MVSQSGPNMPARYWRGLIPRSVVTVPSTRLVHASQVGTAPSFRPARPSASAETPAPTQSHGTVPIQWPKKTAVLGEHLLGVGQPEDELGGERRPHELGDGHQHEAAGGDVGKQAARRDARREEPTQAGGEHQEQDGGDHRAVCMTRICGNLVAELVDDARGSPATVLS